MTATVHVEDASGCPEVPDPLRFARWVEAALDRLGVGEVELAVRVVGSEEMAALNGRYRNRPRPTNVLSFPAELPPEITPRFLGDLAVCAPLVAEEARAQGKDPDAHWAHLVVHGTLHLLGYDHQDEAEAARMETLETEILTALGYSPPYGDDFLASPSAATTHHE